MFDNASQAVPMGSNQNLLALLQLRYNDIVPVGQCPLNCQFEGFKHRKFLLRRLTGIAWVFNNVGVISMVFLHSRGWNVKTASPD